MIARIKSSSIYGIEAFPVDVEVDIAQSLPAFHIVGLPDKAVQEAKERVRSAILNSNFVFPAQRITVNLAPADVKKEGPSFDLPIAMGILIATGQVKCEDISQYVFLGELALDGEIRRVGGVLAVGMFFRSLNAASAFSFVVPEANAKEGALVSGISVYGVRSLSEACSFLQGDVVKQPYAFHPPSFVEPDYDIDFTDVKGQEHAKRALEVAAAGGHNILQVGPPGSGKTMLARRLPTILPPMTWDEGLEVTKLYSVCGMLPENQPLVTSRPFRSPHHTSSSAGLAGGGTYPRPGEVSLSLHGVLFLDEITEFHRDCLEILRQPLEDGVVTISRASATLTFPASFMLVAATNPCPCGFFGDAVRTCTCTPFQIQKYMKKISGPLLDRIDLHVEIPRVDFKDLTKAPGESSKGIRERVTKARRIQQDRFSGQNVSCNAEMKPKHIKKFCVLSPDAQELLKNAVVSLGLSARAHDRIIKMGRTIADLEEKEMLEVRHVAEAVGYRTLDRKLWN